MFSSLYRLADFLVWSAVLVIVLPVGVPIGIDRLCATVCPSYRMMQLADAAREEAHRSSREIQQARAFAEAARAAMVARITR